MPNFALTIAVGALTGLVTSGTVFAAKQFIAKVILPWYENLIYQDVKFEGRWYGYATISGENVERVWEISRQGHNFEATVTSTSGPDKGQVFHVKGSFKNLILTGTYTHADPGNTARGTYAFKLIGDGRKFQGGIAYYSTSEEKIQYGPYSLMRPEEVHGTTIPQKPITTPERA